MLIHQSFLREEGGTRSVTEGACVTLKKAFSCGEGGNSSRSEAGTDRGDTRWLVQDFIRSEYIIGRAIRESPLLGMVGNEVRCRKRSEAHIYVSILKHSQGECAQSKSEHSEDRIALCTIRDLL